MRIKTLTSLALATTALIAFSYSGYAAAPASPQGYITVRSFFDIGGGTAVTDLTGSSKWPNYYDAADYPTYAEWPATGDIATPPPGNVRNSYGMQMVGYFYPPSTGDYIFYIAADDGANLYLSTDGTPENRKLIAVEAGWSGVRSFTAIGGTSTVEAKNSQTYAATEWPTKDPLGGAKITLTAGQAYYIEALEKEGGGGDNLAIAVQDPNFLIAPEAPIPGQYLSSFDLTPGNVSIAEQPASTNVNEGSPVSFHVAPNGTPPFTCQWQKDGVDILDATNLFYSIQFASAADNNKPFTAVITGGAGSPVTSAAAILTVNADTTVPTVVEAAGGSDFVSVTVKFSERVDLTGATFTVSDGVTVSGALLSAGDTAAVITTSRQTGGQVYTLTINGVKDKAATPNTIAPNTAIQFNSAVFKESLVRVDRWDYTAAPAIATVITGVADGSIGVPTATTVGTIFESGRGLGANYAARMFGWFVPATSGDYVFYLTADDNARLFLSADENPANKKAIAAEATWSDNRQWAARSEEQSSATYQETEWPTFGQITLTAGSKYYLEALWQEGGGGDGCEITYTTGTEAEPANGEASKITGARIGLYVDPSTLPPVITARPRSFKTQDVTVYNRGDTLSYQVTATTSKQPLSYQWYRSQLLIPGATNDTLTIANAGPEATGDYSVRVSNPNGTADSWPDNDARAMLANPFVIEGEDYNYNTGQTIAEASTMPYLGNAYTNLSTAVLDIDLWQNGDDSGASVDANRYARNPVAADYHVELANEAGANLDRGSWTNTAGYKIGWTRTGAWQNYTRTIPKAGTYMIFDAASYDARNSADIISHTLSRVANPRIADGSSLGVEGGLQGLTRIGTFKNPGSGGWSNLDLIPCRKDDGSLATVDLPAGEVTLRVTFNKNDGDFDYIMLYEVVGGGNPTLGQPTLSGGNVTIPFTGRLESAPAVTGPWNTVTGATPPSYTTPATASQYYRSAIP